jgi:hypothetical protein
MKTRIITIVAGVLLAVGAVALPAGRAEAHDYDNYATLFCEAHKSGPEVTVTHAWPYSLQPGLVTYRCTQVDPDVFAGEWQYFAVWHTPSGAHWRQGGYQHCSLVVCPYH